MFDEVQSQQQLGKIRSYHSSQSQFSRRDAAQIHHFDVFIHDAAQIQTSSFDPPTVPNWPDRRSGPNTLYGQYGHTVRSLFGWWRGAREQLCWSDLVVLLRSNFFETCKSSTITVYLVQTFHVLYTLGIIPSKGR